MIWFILIYVVSTIVLFALHVYEAKRFNYTWGLFFDGFYLLFIPVLNTTIILAILLYGTMYRLSNKWDDLMIKKVFGEKK
jgi:hypothetical protein